MKTEKPYRLKFFDAETHQTIVYFKRFASSQEAEQYYLSNHVPAVFNGWEVEIIKLIKEVA